MIFFTNPAPTGVSAPAHFRAKGNTTDVPTSPSDALMAAVPKASPSKEFGLYKEFFYAIAYSAATKTKAAPRDYYAVDDIVVPDNFLPGYPVIGVKFPISITETVNELCTRHGLTRDSVNKTVFYKGSIGPEAASEILREGGDPASYLPYGIANIDGLLSFIKLRKIAFAALSAFPTKLLDDKFCSSVVSTSGNSIDGEAEGLLDHSRIICPASTTNLNKVGHLAPYFDGMTLPDKSFVPTILTTYSLVRLLGSDAAGVANGTAKLSKGWRALCYTPQGKQLAHLFQCLHLGLSARMRVRMLVNANNQYVGCAILGGSALVKGGSIIPAITAPKLFEEQKSLDGNEGAKRRLAAIFNEHFGSKDTVFTAEMFNNARGIHKLIISHTVTPPIRVQIKECLDSLDLPQEFYNHRSVPLLEKTIKSIARGEVDDSAPIPVRSEVMFSKNKYQQILAAYGDRAPSFLLPNGPKLAPLFKAVIAGKGKTARQTNPTLQKAGVTHLPVYVLPLEQAAAAWEQLVAGRCLQLKEKSGRPVGAVMNLDGRKDDAHRLLNLLANNFVTPATAGKKRAREEKEDGGMTAENIKRIAKRLKISDDTAREFLRLAAKSTVGSEPAEDWSGEEEEMDDE